MPVEGKMFIDVTVSQVYEVINNAANEFNRVLRQVEHVIPDITLSWELGPDAILANISTILLAIAGLGKYHLLEKNFELRHDIREQFVWNDNFYNCLNESGFILCQKMNKL